MSSSRNARFSLRKLLCFRQAKKGAIAAPKIKPSSANRFVSYLRSILNRAVDDWHVLGKAPAIKDASATIDFDGLAPGKYAMVCYHDENGNGKFDENALGMPKEGYCFSNNIKPRFSATRIER